MKKSPFIIQLFVIAVILTVAFSASCDRRNPPVVIPPAPEPVSASELRFITKMAASVDTIYADNNITFSTISVTVKDGDGFAVPSQMVQFKSDIGRLLTNVATDSSGVATTTFWDDGDIGEATILALVKNYAAESDSVVSEDSDTINVTIIDVPAIDYVSLEIPSTLMTVMQSMTVSARAKNVLGNDVPDNTLITFTAGRGYFVDAEGNTIGDAIVVKTINGRASATYNAGPISGTGTLTASLSDVESSRVLTIGPDHPFSLLLYSHVGDLPDPPEADSSFVGDPTPIWMRAYLKDKYNNVCPQKPVRFTTDLGTFANTTQTSSKNTDGNGMAQVRFTPGLSAGAATINAYANNDTLNVQKIFNVISDDIYSITFTQAGQINLHVANTGGTSSAVLRVKLNDINGNLIDTSQQVFFKIMNNPPPAGANLNNAPTSEEVEVWSTGGEAVISVNSGTEPGVLSIRARCTNNAGQNITSTKSNIVIYSGPPHAVIPFISGYASGTAIGGGVWRIEAGATVTDLYGNPVQYGTAVWFSLPNLTFNCQVGADAYTGNLNAEADSTAGTAYTYLTYSGYQTNEVLVLRAETLNGANVVWGESDIKLPIGSNTLRVTMVAFPSQVSFGPTSPEFREAQIYYSLTDEQGCQIHGSEVFLTSIRGCFPYFAGHDILYPNPFIGPHPYYTGVNQGHRITTGTDGVAEGTFRIYRLEIDPAVDEPRLTTIEIQASILETGTDANTNLTFNAWAFPYPPPG